MDGETKKVIMLDYKNPFSQDDIRQIRDIMQGTHNSTEDIMFYIARNKSKKYDKESVRKDVFLSNILIMMKI